MAKIETPEAIENIDEIISATDVIMVARGDLAVEVPTQEVPHLQRMIIEKCQVKGRLVIVATQMMESMIKNPVPTRAEVSDVANAILNGADAIMLSAETTVGDFPVEAVAMMTEIAKRTEQEIKYKPVKDNEKYTKDTVNAVARSVIRTALDVEAKYIVALTESGYTARKISRYRPAQKIIALTPDRKTIKQLKISYGCYPEYIGGFHTVSETVAETKKILTERNIVKKGDKIVIVAGIPFGQSGATNMMIVEEI